MSFHNTINRPQFGQGICGNCGERQWSIGDNRYLQLFGRCWSCDKKDWENGRLSLEAFKELESMAIKSQ